MEIRSVLRSTLGAGLRLTRTMSRGLGEIGVIVAFHRVNDQTAGDALTRGTADYARFCRFFRRHFDVVPLADMIAAVENGTSTRGQLAVTHDDGYLDNYEEALPILEDVGIPATFFISAGLMGTDVVAEWDREIDPPPRWMSWEQVRSMRDRGFTIGAHTSTHVDLGAVDGEVATPELVTSREQLERELGETVDLFAYPFGGAENITPANRERVRAAGYRCCLSCHGGLVEPGADVFDLPRVPISPWYENPDQLALALGTRRA